MPSHDEIRLRHMLDSALEAVKFAYGILTEPKSVQMGSKILKNVY